MTDFLPVGRAINDIRVDHTPSLGGMRARVTIRWIDGAGAQQEVERYGTAIIADLHACTLLGEAPRRAYLIGYIRCQSLRREER